MQTLFSTDTIPVRDRFRLWRETTRTRLPPFEMWGLGDAPFEAQWESVAIGGLTLSRTTFSAHRVQHGSCSARHNADQDKLICVIRLAGTARSDQYGRSTQERPGDITLFDRAAPMSHSFDEPMRTLRLDLPRERVERMLGPARLFAALPINADLPCATLARTFLSELLRVHRRLSPDMAERMAGVGVDLLVASLAERMAQDAPKPIQGTVIVQRAKAYVEANLGDPTLNPPQLAVAVGVSLRRLQELFHEHGQPIADWIWERRLDTAARRLTDPGHAHLAIGTLAYGCGFTNQAHFAKRFRARYDLTPSEYRRAAHLATATD